MDKGGKPGDTPVKPRNSTGHAQGPATKPQPVAKQGKGGPEIKLPAAAAAGVDAKADINKPVPANPNSTGHAKTAGVGVKKTLEKLGTDLGKGAFAVGATVAAPIINLALGAGSVEAAQPQNGKAPEEDNTLRNTAIGGGLLLGETAAFLNHKLETNYDTNGGLRTRWQMRNLNADEKAAFRSNQYWARIEENKEEANQYNNSNKKMLDDAKQRRQGGGSSPASQPANSQQPVQTNVRRQGGGSSPASQPANSQQPVQTNVNGASTSQPLSGEMGSNLPNSSPLHESEIYDPPATGRQSPFNLLSNPRLKSLGAGIKASLPHAKELGKGVAVGMAGGTLGDAIGRNAAGAFGADKQTQDTAGIVGRASGSLAAPVAASKLLPTVFKGSKAFTPAGIISLGADAAIRIHENNGGFDKDAGKNAEIAGNYKMASSVLGTAATFATMGAIGGPLGAGVGFVVGAGIGYWAGRNETDNIAMASGLTQGQMATSTIEGGFMGMGGQKVTTIKDANGKEVAKFRKDGSQLQKKVGENWVNA